VDVNTITLVVALAIMLIALIAGAIWFYTNNKKVEKLFEKIIDLLMDLRF